ncbi:hypothetical protein RUM44_009973 [Polyplax serrata]|uniref:Ig-like domain-containing protein n=1 Tax=Polyplax serrata TaxID=468196 RepID=A0ABR1AU66_POLSC
MNTHGSDEWFKLKILDCQPQLANLGETLVEARDLLAAHEVVLRQLESKQSPVEELLRQADQLISNQRPRAEVYAAMAESLGLAWKDVNGHLAERKQILELNVDYKREEQNCVKKMEQLELICLDGPIPIEIDAVKELLSKLHAGKRAMLEALMATLQEGKQLLEKLRILAQEGTTDSRPDNIKPSAERAVSKVEHWLENLHDRRKQIEVIWQARKTQVEQCLALALLAIELLEIENLLKARRESLTKNKQLGDSKASAQLLLEEIRKTLVEAKNLQDRTLKITKSTEKLVGSEHFAGEEAISQSYAVLNESTEHYNSVETREELLEKTVRFFDAAEHGLEKLSEIQQILTMDDQSLRVGNLHLEMVDAIQKSTEPAITLGNDILDSIGHKAPEAEGIRNMLNKLRSQMTNLEESCTATEKQKLHASQQLNEFLEKYNEIYSWLLTTVDAFLQGHQDMGSVLAISRDYLNLHKKLLNEFQMKEEEFKSFVTKTSDLLGDLEEEQKRDGSEKMKSLQDHWMKLKFQLENRVDLSKMYVAFHSKAVEVTSKYDLIEDELKKRATVGDDDTQNIHANCRIAEDMFVELSHTGNNFIEDSQKVMDQCLDVKRAGLCIETILDQLRGRQLTVSDLWRSWTSSVHNRRGVLIQWNKIMAECNMTLNWTEKIQSQLYPILLEDYESCEDVIRELERKEEIVIPEIKKAEAEIEARIKEAEELALKGEAPPDENKSVLKELLNVHDELQTTLTEYQVLVQMLQSFFKNLSEVEKTIQNINEQNQVENLSEDVHEVESVIKEHEAYCQAVTELFKFTKTESEGIISKITAQEPEHVRQLDVAKIRGYLNKKQEDFEAESIEKKIQLDQHRQLCQFDEDLKEINTTLSNLNDQLISIRGQYGESLAAAKATSQGFVFFEKTIEVLGERIKTFTENGDELLSSRHSSSRHIENELTKLKDKWREFRDQVRESRRLINLSIEYFVLVEDAEEWFKDGSKLLVTIARKTTSVKKPEEANQLLNEVDIFLKPGELRQDERIKKIGELASQVFGEEGTKRLHPVLHENREMVESFTLISRELNNLALNLKQSEEERLKEEQKEIDASLMTVKAEALAAKAAAAAAEEARRAAEMAAKVLQEAACITKIQKVEIKEVTSIINKVGKVDDTQEVVEVEEEEESTQESDKERLPSPPKKLKMDETAPEFIVPLKDAIISEGKQFKFECKLTGNPTPEILWLKDDLSVQNNPDYQTKFDAKDGACTLTIDETFVEDSARFTCRATNSVGKAETSALLTVADTSTDENLVPPKFTKPLKAGSCREGGTYELSCHVEGFPLPTVQWFKGDVCVDNSPDYVITYNNGEAKLRFEQVFLEDQSEYTCKASNTAGTDKTKAFFEVEPLEPTEAPEVTQELSSVAARAGEKIKLQCHVRGLPEPEIFWHHDGKKIKTNRDVTTNYADNIATLSITEIYPKDGGTYKMTAKNIAGEAQSTCTVTVKALPSRDTSVDDSEMASEKEPTKPSIQLQLRDQTVVEGKTVLLECVIVGQPEPEVIWYRDGEPVKESDDILLLFQGDHCSLLIKDVYVEDAGVYKVVAINCAGEVSSCCRLRVNPAKEEETEPEAEVEVDEEVEEGVESEKVEIVDVTTSESREPKFTKLLSDVVASEGEKVCLECCVTGEPEPDVRWYFNNQPIKITENTQIDEDAEGNITLTLLSATLQDKGVYTVKANNSSGEAESFAQVTVEKKEVEKEMVQEVEEEEMEEETEEKSVPPVFTKKFEDATVKENDEVIFECAVNGSPVPEVKWKVNDEIVSGDNYKILSDDDHHALVIRKASKKENGDVSCVAENQAGKAVYTAKLTVRDTSLHKEFKLIPFIEPKLSTQDDMDVSTTVSTKREIVVESTVSRNTTMSTTVGSDSEKPHVEVHSYSSKDEKSVKQINEEPVQEVESHESKEYHKINDEPPVTKEDSSIVSTVGSQFGELAKSNSLTLMLGSKIGRKTMAPRFVTPVQGKIVDQGADVELEGVIEGFPPPSITWTKNGADVEPEENKIEMSYERNRATLKIFSADVKDAGKYCCSASNSVGNASSTSDLVIKKIGFPPVLGKRLQAQVVPRGERARLEIEVTGSPEPTVTWYKDDKPIKSSDMFRIHHQGNCYTLTIDNATDEHTGRYMVKATNADGMTQTMADLHVSDGGQTENFAKVTTYHDKIQSAIQSKPESNEENQTVENSSNVVVTENRVVPGESVTMTETIQTQKIIQMKLEKKEGLPIEVPKKVLELEPAPEIKEDTQEALAPSVEEKTETVDETSTRSSLEFFKAVMRQEEELKKEAENIRKEQESVPAAPAEQVPVTSEPETATPVSKEPAEAKQTSLIVQEKKSSFSKVETIDRKIEPIETHEAEPTLPKPQQEEQCDLHPEPPPEIGFVPKTESTKTYEDVSHKVKKLEEFHKSGSPMEPPSGGVRLLPLLFPKPETPVKQEVKVEKERVIETLPALSWLSDDQPFSKEDREVFQSTQSIKMEEKKTQSWGPTSLTSVPNYSSPQLRIADDRNWRPSSPRPSAEGVAMEKLWTTKKPYEDYKPDSLKPHGIYRPPSSLEPMRAASPRPSAEGIAMEKLWAPRKPLDTRPASSLGFENRFASPVQPPEVTDKIWAQKHKESTQTSTWARVEPKESAAPVWCKTPPAPAKIWSPYQAPSESITTYQSSEMKSHEMTSKHFQEINYPRGPEIKSLPPNVPVTHYIAESRLIRQTQSMDRQLKYTSESSSSMQQRYWFEDSSSKYSSNLQAPSLVKKVTEFDNRSYSSNKIAPGPPPDFRYAPKVDTKATDFKTVNKETRKTFYNAPSYRPATVLPVRREMKRSTSLEAKPFERFPDLEPFPFKPDPPKPKPAKCPPPPTPTKFVKCAGSDYESDYDSQISMKWRPYESDGEDFRYRRVQPPSPNYSRRPQSTGPEPLPPSKFEDPPQFYGPPRPTVDTVAFCQGQKQYQQRSSSDTRETKKKVFKVKTGPPPQFLQTQKFKPEPPPVKQMGQERFGLQQTSSVREMMSQTCSYENYSTQSTREFQQSKKLQEPVPLLESFPYKPDVIKPIPRKGGPPPPMPSKFIKGEFKGTDYESDYECRIQPVWNSEGQTYKPVRPVLTPSGRHPSSVAGRTPTPPTEFDVPPAMYGASRPKFEPIAPETGFHSAKSQMLIKPKPVTPKVAKPEIPLKPGSPPELAYASPYPKAVETSNVMSFQEDTETSRRIVNLQQTTRMISFGEKKEKWNVESNNNSLNRTQFPHSPFKKVKSVDSFSKSNYSSTRVREPDIILQPGEPPEIGYAQLPVSAATSYADKHITDMTQSFKSKAQKFVTDIMTDTKKPDKSILKSSLQTRQKCTGQEAHAYREENRLSERGTKHIDPDTGLIYFKYDFGYEFGIVLPGEGGKKAISGGNKPPDRKIVRRESIDFPIIHEKTGQGESYSVQPKKCNYMKSVKWDPMSEGEMSDTEDFHKRRNTFPMRGPQVPHWEAAPSPLSISPMSCQRSTPIDTAASPTWMRGGTPTSTTPGLKQKDVVNQSWDPPAKPNFITPLKDIAVVSGQPARFECIVQAEPAPNILWMKDGRILENSHYHEIQYKNGVCRLTVLRAYPADAGSYRCTATNMVGSAETIGTLIVPEIGFSMGRVTTKVVGKPSEGLSRNLIFDRGFGSKELD